MRVLVVVHQPDAGPGVFAAAAAAGGHELVEWSPARELPPPDEIDAVIVLGGAMHPDEEDEHPWLRPEKALLADLLRARTPTLGVCLGAELVAEAAGAPARRMAAPEVGWRELELTPAADGDPVLGGLPPRFTAFEWHSFETPLPHGATSLAGGGGGRVDAFRLGAAWALQFHAEATRETIEGWIDRYGEDADVVAAGIDPEPLRRATRSHIGASNEVGAALCRRFLDHAAGVAGRAA